MLLSLVLTLSAGCSTSSLEPELTRPHLPPLEERPTYEWLEPRLKTPKGLAEILNALKDAHDNIDELVREGAWAETQEERAFLRHLHY